MKINIITPDQFNIVPWKNGKGQTTELIINPGGSLTDFDWRLSIADMVSDGVFSSFAGMQRHLILHSGQGLTLTHSQNDHQIQQDTLNAPLDIAAFDGAFYTAGDLSAGAVKNFNVMSKTATYHSQVSTYFDHQSIELPHCAHCFVYCLEGQASLTPANKTLQAGQLLHLDHYNDNQQTISGEKLIVVAIESKINTH